MSPLQKRVWLVDPCLSLLSAQINWSAQVSSLYNPSLVPPTVSKNHLSKYMRHNIQTHLPRISYAIRPNTLLCFDLCFFFFLLKDIFMILSYSISSSNSLIHRINCLSTKKPKDIYYECQVLPMLVTMDTHLHSLWANHHCVFKFLPSSSFLSGIVCVSWLRAV